MPKSAIQPLCRFCGKPIRKWTTAVQFGREADGRPGIRSQYFAQRPEYPHSKEEAQKLVNEKIVSTRWERGYWAEKHGQPYIDQVTVWDGESYMDLYFCTGEHAKEFAYAVAARNDMAMQAYWDALAEQKAKRLA